MILKTRFSGTFALDPNEILSCQLPQPELLGRVPFAPRHLRGLIEYQGKLFSVIDLEVLHDPKQPLLSEGVWVLLRNSPIALWVNQVKPSLSTQITESFEIRSFLETYYKSLEGIRL